MTRRKAAAEAVKFGCTIDKDGGDIVIRHPKIDWTLRVNNRRKDAPRSLMLFLRKVQELRNASKQPPQ